MAGSSFDAGLVALAADVLKASESKGLKIATAESCTGGLLSGLLTEVPGSSSVVERGFVTYSNAAKVEMLGVPASAIEEFGAVSEPVALAMVEGALANSDAQISVSITGIAGPGGSEFKPEGRVCFAIAVADGEVRAETCEFGALGRAEVRAAAVRHALHLLETALT